MLTAITPLLAAFFLSRGLTVPTIPYPFPNSTALTNGTAPNGTVEYHCNDIFPTDLTVLNERYPDYNTSRLHDAIDLFMLRREVAEQGEIATRVQFTGLPSANTNITCRLEFIFPAPDQMLVQGYNPTFNVYQVERDTETISTWKQYVGNGIDADLFGQVNGQPEAIERTRSVGGVAAINETRCNETMTFQMGMAYDSKGGAPNYWNFTEVAPPAWPVQGFRMVWGC
ncbi:hypothetical protein HBH56_241320 [Parastagonospora nodorum]|uniref:Ubiquitin 3 binding protein But2 C-terminal domain-containing protein n=2 Tax=Phaeosphaeria nodorum (strain SN15 / ATCC MYA-4574 / FGSC 10173) TaxID=321614 RepID=A0A7U2FEI2_PHANO|nr:hypothetical protein SNOG_16387 [Parastagonospora nodorum SN15]KAH3903989.1 hypothetical protein HBH56_241320 [Parastagonospora nodorum]EAT76212.2 hypothetical protein SNOG_16387 [Parastagonospora nodorum SN15]KAH3921231.1 hypothetical protein HBH54_243080 [Parastagonospora nodorum]KAH3939080.1 hypothetical protein HBH53_241010 [Parastagonospora nodorum]KAH4042736.1 hypothetical protein HBH49_244520 [Parastagonospora nodorum]